MKKPEKAYKNIDFLNSKEARTLRILSEYLEPEKRFLENKIKHTVVFFGSSRIQTPEKDMHQTSQYYQAAQEFAFKLGCLSEQFKKKGDTFVICSGGGPGIMEAANQGASQAKADSIGLNISIPHEQFPNSFVSPHLSFEFHYFFMRKLWFLYHAKAVVCFPGGFGTLDELFETLTLIQTKKLEKTNFAILLYDQSFWEKLINFPMLIEKNLISETDYKLIQFFETPQAGLDILEPILKRAILSYQQV